MQLYVIWISFCSWIVATGWILSFFKELNSIGYGVSFAISISLISLLKFTGKDHPISIHRLSLSRLIKRFKRPLPLIYLFCFLAALIGGALNPPTNYDALCYRIPRILHWINQSQWHWVGGWNTRLDWSSTGFEWLMLPQILLLRTDRLLFLINVFSYALLPGLIYSSFTGLGISRRVAWYWMWILPTGYSFALQAGSIGNDSYATVFFLSAVTFALRAVRRLSYSDAALAVFSTALLTGAKASNLPLLLPLLLVLIPTLGLLLKNPIKTLGVIAVAGLISFLPLAYFNTIHTGGWNGDPHNLEKLQVDNPAVCIAGNSMQLFIGAFAPPVLPMAKILNSKIDAFSSCGPLLTIKQNFPRLVLTTGELPTEEGAGMGLGITLIFCISLLAGIFSEQKKIKSQIALYFGLLCWVSFLVLISKLGSDGIARYTVVYASGMVLPVLALCSQRNLVERRWWRVTAIICQLAVLPALILNPARPMLPISSIIDIVEHAHLMPALTERIRLVYRVYANRNDQLSLVREHLPPDVKTIGFAGTGDESEYSFWQPLGSRIVRDLNPVDGKIPDIHGLDVIVGSEWGFRDRYHLGAKELTHDIGGSILWTGKVATVARREAVTWYIIEMPVKKINEIP